MAKQAGTRSPGNPAIASTDDRNHGKPSRMTKSSRPGQGNILAPGQKDGHLESGHMSPRDTQIPHGQPKTTHMAPDDHGTNRMQRGDKWNGLPNKAFTDSHKK